MLMLRRSLIYACALCVVSVLAGDAGAASRKGAAASPRQKSARAQKPVPRRQARVEYLKNATGTRSLPFSEAVRVGEMLYLSGQIGVDDKGALVAGGIEAETRQTFENMRAVLERHGSSLSRVVKCTVMLADVKNDFAPMNAVYRTYFAPDRMPARSTFGASGLVLGARVEIECWATVQ